MLNGGGLCTLCLCVVGVEDVSRRGGVGCSKNGARAAAAAGAGGTCLLQPLAHAVGTLRVATGGTILQHHKCVPVLAQLC